MKLTRWGLSHFYCPCLLPWLLPAVPPHLRNLHAPPLPQSRALPSGSVRCSRCSCELARLCARLFPVFVSALGSWPCLQRLPLSPRNILRKASEENETDLLPECWTWLGRCWARSLSCCKRWQWVCTQRRVQDPARWPESACRETTGSGADPESCWDSADCVIWTSGPAGRERTHRTRPQKLARQRDLLCKKSNDECLRTNPGIILITRAEIQRLTDPT